MQFIADFAHFERGKNWSFVCTKCSGISFVLHLEYIQVLIQCVLELFSPFVKAMMSESSFLICTYHSCLRMLSVLPSHSLQATIAWATLTVSSKSFVCFETSLTSTQNLSVFNSVCVCFFSLSTFMHEI